METQCSQRSFGFQHLGRREIVARFDGGRVTSDGGGILLRQIEERFGLIERFAACFTDHRDPASIEHSVTELLKQRLFGLCLGYEDLNDHDWLRHDAMLAVLVGKGDPEGQDRRQRRDRGKALAGKSTRNRTYWATGTCQREWGADRRTGPSIHPSSCVSAQPISSHGHGGAPNAVGGFPLFSPTCGSRCRSLRPNGTPRCCTNSTALVSGCSSHFSFRSSFCTWPSGAPYVPIPLNIAASNSITPERNLK
jgi:hypothetical protein